MIDWSRPSSRRTPSGYGPARVRRAWFLLVALLGACALPGRGAKTEKEPDLSGASDPPSRALLSKQISDDAHLDDVGFALLRSARSRCSEVKPRAAFRFINRPAYQRMWQPFAAELGFTDTVRIVSVATGGGADRGGLRADDRVVAVDGLSATPGDRTLSTLRGRIAKLADAGATSLAVTVRREGREQALTIPLDSTCALSFMSWRDDGPDAWSGPQVIAVTTGMLAFLANDDELAMLLAHEIAHRLARDARPKGRFDAVTDVTGDLALGALGFATDDRWIAMKQARPTAPADGAEERRADELTVEILRKAGRSVTGVRAFWRRLLGPDPSRMPYVRAHELSVERLLRLEELSAAR